ncbi:MAG: SUMF1/EgtB/PvdO family nonheme iron enzyme [Bacteroidota bacterium]
MKCSTILRPMLWAFFLITSPLFGNNIQVDHVRLAEQNTASQFTKITFNLSWENSWRYDSGPANWDAAWVFAKFRINNGAWQHASINYVNGSALSDGHTEPVDATITTPADGRGVFIYRANVGDGDIDWRDIQLRWNYGADGVGNNAFVDVEVFAIEMVYVPQGAFALGGGNGSEVGKLFAYTGALNSTSPYLVNSEALISVGTSNGDIYYPSPVTDAAGDQLGPIPAAFPKGYEAFYCMKYEVSQEQWTAFFNLLTLTQQQANDITDNDHRGPNSIDRNSLDWDGQYGATTQNPTTPLSFPLWGEILAYMDWAGLRPITEFEFVKACRGPLLPVVEGYAWGTANIIDPTLLYDLVNKNTEAELLSNHASGIGNANWINSAIIENGPYRTGIFAASASEQGRREDAGASYYGIMEMSGNLSEMAVSIGSPQGRAYIGNHGDGLLLSTGEADVAGWPPATGEGGGLFGGSWFSVPESLWINDRRDATAGNVGYFNDVGFRAVRTAP